jgi:outer membrane PBP1 activator LpoA protein
MKNGYKIDRKIKNTNTLSQTLLATALVGLMIVSGIVVSTASTQSNATTMNATKTTNSTTASVSSPDNPITMKIDAAISSIKNGKSDEGRKLLLETEKSLEGKSSLADSEKRIEAALKTLKDGDSIGSISQAKEAKKSLIASL